MLLFCLKFQNRLHSPQAQACVFFISQKHALWTIRNKKFQSYCSKKRFLEE